MADVEQVNLEMRVIDLIERWPATRAVLAAHGLDLCCGGSHSVSAAAGAHGVNPDILFAEIVAAVKGGVRQAH